MEPIRQDTETFIVNPYIAGSPVKDMAMFFGREDVYAWLRQHLHGQYQDNVIVLYGERRSGKTSVLYQMKDRLGDKRYIPVLLDLQGMSLERMDGFLWEVARKIVMALRGVEGVPLLDRPARQDFEGNARHYFEDVFLPPILASLGQRRLLLMFDEANRLEEKVASGDLPPDVFDYLRALIQQISRLNFLFALGSRIESLRRSFALFNLAVYRKISFLDPDFAEDLITWPVRHHYTYTRGAIDRILRLTAGQAYYTQLICHNLFTRWAQTRPPTIKPGDIDAVLPDVLEQGTPNLKFVWDDSTPVEQAILAGLADAIPRYRAGILRRNLDRELAKARLYPPSGDVTSGLQKLFERDLVNPTEPYEFRIALLQMWFDKYKKLDWVREELGQVAQEWEDAEMHRRAHEPTLRERWVRRGVPVLGGVLLGGLIASGLYWQGGVVQDQARATEVALLQASIGQAERVRVTEVARLQATIAAASTKQASNVNGNPQAVAEARATAQAAEAMAAIALARVTEVSQKEATAAAAATQAAELAQAGQVTQAAAAGATATAAQAESYQLAAPTPADTPIPTATATPLPTFTPLPTWTPPPTATPLSLVRGRLAIPVFANGRYDVHIYAVPGGQSLGVIPGVRQPNFRHSDGHLVVNGQGGQGETLWVYDADGRDGRPASPSPADSHPFWSPNGQKLVYDNPELLGKDLRRVWRVFVQGTLDAPGPADVLPLQGDILDEFSPLYPLWAEDDSIIFYACNYWAEGSRCGTWRTPASATKNFQLPQAVTTQSEIPTDTWGNRVLVMGNPTGDWEVYLATLDGGTPQNLSNFQAVDGLAAFSPDGQWVAFVSSRSGGWGVWYVPVSGGEAVRLPIDDLKFGSGDLNWTTERISWGF